MLVRLSRTHCGAGASANGARRNTEQTRGTHCGTGVPETRVLMRLCPAHGTRCAAGVSANSRARPRANKQPKPLQHKGFCDVARRRPVAPDYLRPATSRTRAAFSPPSFGNALRRSGEIFGPVTMPVGSVEVVRIGLLEPLSRPGGGGACSGVEIVAGELFGRRERGSDCSVRSRTASQTPLLALRCALVSAAAHASGRAQPCARFGGADAASICRWSRVRPCARSC